MWIARGSGASLRPMSLPMFARERRSARRSRSSSDDDTTTLVGHGRRVRARVARAVRGAVRRSPRRGPFAAGCRASRLPGLTGAHGRRCPRESGSRLLQVVLVPRDRKSLTAARAQLLRHLGGGERDAIAASWTDEVASPERFRRAAERHLWVPEHSPLP